MTIYDDEIKIRALECGYSEAEIAAGLEFQSRKSRKANPPGCFDQAGRFYADEETQAVRMCRTPSRAFPYSQMQAARTAAHCGFLGAGVGNQTLPENAGDYLSTA